MDGLPRASTVPWRPRVVNLPVVPESVGRGLLDAHEGLSIQDAVIHMDWVATVLPLSLRL